MPAPVYIHDFNVACALGDARETVAQALFAEDPPVVSGWATLSNGKQAPVGRLPFEPPGADNETRSNRLLVHVAAPLAAGISARTARHGAERLAVVIGTSTSGIVEGERALVRRMAEGAFPDDFRFANQELGDPARVLAARLGAMGPAYAVSTACTSGAKALAAGARLLAAGLADTVVAGGVDTLCDLTLNGFAALDSMSDAVCNPMSRNRRGINIGEGAALFILAREPGPHCLLGAGESSDAHHISAPDPAGKGAEAAIGRALARAGCGADAVDFIHLHGTATRLNDQMEAAVVARLFTGEPPACSTKPLTGHMLGAAGAAQAAFCLLALRDGRTPRHVWDGEADPDVARIALSAGGRGRVSHVLSTSYAFGGNNIALVLANG